ncbi:MBL fold metallo-hydrolase [Phragmitibacter flavus]|uniref:MBL fold metallo-hydrolase n=1 Tax=Phragmitibacter flavus TaxID=2576071 RepID=A0A5R8KDS1_9BACT|nr:MBL fold metallo-hydrolase [Phragmitibacter flavus]TLD69739.1 MBL fold metallo-hydrolase [Phragmitibacter flavus]
MKVRFWGTRGSLATPGKATLKYGGNTSCVQVIGDQGTMVVLDAGTGMREMSLNFPPGLKRVDVLLTHLHMDHIQGLGFFSPFYNRDMEVHLWGPRSTTQDLRGRLMRYLSPPLFPVHLRDLECRLFVHDASDADVQIGEFRVSSRMICHPGPTVGYRLVGPKGSLAYMPDHEPAIGATRLLPDRDWVSGAAVAKEVDLLIHDAQYTDEEYAARVGWGHSSMKQAMEFARMTEVRHLVPFHYDPTHGDEVLETMLKENIAAVNPAYPVTPAREGETMEVRG